MSRCQVYVSDQWCDVVCEEAVLMNLLGWKVRLV